MPRASRSGFTLIEVLVALTLGVGVLMGARGLLDGMVGGTARLLQSSTIDEARENSAWSFRQLVSNLALPAGDSAAFVGEMDRASFSSWCATGGGWRERCAVTVRVSGQGSAHVAASVVAMLSDRDSLVIGRAARRATLLYLASAQNGGRWLRAWEPSLIPPQAIGVVIDDDTLVARIGGRR